ncbi:hypothetical protein LX36DRAFT_65287 [Colletotrichum falcatum]|nr:hypothetical protein LX36DRAFT_65287 [Colletotrichum falcatum]
MVPTSLSSEDSPVLSVHLRVSMDFVPCPETTSADSFIWANCVPLTLGLPRTCLSRPTETTRGACWPWTVLSVPVTIRSPRLSFERPHSVALKIPAETSSTIINRAGADRECQHSDVVGRDGQINACVLRPHYGIGFCVSWFCFTAIDSHDDVETNSVLVSKGSSLLMPWGTPLARLLPIGFCTSANFVDSTTALGNRHRGHTKCHSDSLTQSSGRLV